MKRHWQLYIFLGFILFSCGLKEVTKLSSSHSTIAPIETLVLEEGGCANAVTPESTELLEEAQKFYSDIAIFVSVHNMLTTSNLFVPQTLSTGTFLKATPLRPMVLNLDELRADYKRVLAKWNQSISPNTMPLRRQVVAIEKEDRFESFFQELNALLVKIRRYQSLSCKKEELSKRSKRDLRGYYQFLEGGSKPEEICALTRSLSSCLIEYNMMRRKNQGHEFVSHYKKPFEEIHDSFFQFNGKTKFQCVKDGQKKKLLIPLDVDQFFFDKIGQSYELLNSIVGKKWGHDNFSLIFLPYVKGKHQERVSVKWSQSHVSYVETDKPYVIYLSKYLNQKSLLTTFAHELGHTFGFPDCYHEFFDKESDSLIYYSLDESETNLMCHLEENSIIPKSYLEFLEKSHCD